MANELLREVVGAFLQKAVLADNLPPEDPLRKAGAPIADAFTEGVRCLKSFPNEAVRSLMADVWDIVGHKITPVAIGPNVPTLTVGMHGGKHLQQAMIFAPLDWIAMIKKDAINELGALVFVGSEAVDFYNGRLAVDTSAPAAAMNTRAAANEAEFLHTLQRMYPAWTPNDYQKRIMGDFPLGLQTPRVQEFLYTRKPFSPPS